MNIPEYVALCGAMSPLGKLVLFSDLTIAIAYFAIPIALVIVWSRRKDDLPYPWMFALFAAFIVGCGLTHLVHAIQMPYTTFEHTIAEASVKAACAVLSLGTAAALIAIMPTVLRLVSPRERARVLELEVAERTRENTMLLREVNHRLGNQLQVMSSVVRVEQRRARHPEQREVLNRIQEVVSELVSNYHAEQARMRGGEVTPTSAPRGETEKLRA